jgi:hypothetical protein
MDRVSQGNDNKFMRHTVARRIDKTMFREVPLDDVHEPHLSPHSSSDHISHLCRVNGRSNEAANYNRYMRVDSNRFEISAATGQLQMLLRTQSTAAKL